MQRQCTQEERQKGARMSPGWRTDDGNPLFCGGRRDSEVQMREGLMLIKDVKMREMAQNLADILKEARPEKEGDS